ncbi:MAG: hypothetical protein LBT14_07980 [Treponema sp.]|jgi:hypothetical protein|nr:hypothetical protein [Treponema sp.]
MKGVGGISIFYIIEEDRRNGVPVVLNIVLIFLYKTACMGCKIKNSAMSINVELGVRRICSLARKDFKEKSSISCGSTTGILYVKDLSVFKTADTEDGTWTPHPRTTMGFTRLGISDRHPLYGSSRSSIN